MKQINVEEVKAIEIQILNFIDDICREHNFVYYLAGGTLLGAVRHKGFIPWDDDIDIIMPRKQYHDFIQAVNDANTQYKIISAYNDPDYKKLFIKVVDSNTYLEEKDSIKCPNMGVFVDVFPLDVLPNDDKKRKSMKYKAWYLRQIMGHALLWEKGNIERPFAYRVGCFLCYLFGWRKAFNIFENLTIKTANMTSNYAANLSDAPNKSFEWDSSCFDTSVLLPFEGKMYPAAGNYDEYLKGYGDYMKLPPIEKRISNHDFVAYYR